MLVLADGTVFEGKGFGAACHAVGEVCFNTAMTGYQEILTDPSYAGQIVAFTFPHIGIVGTNSEDIEVADAGGARAGGARRCGASIQLARAVGARPLARNRTTFPASAGIDTRALTARIREKGMPHGVVAHAPDGRFDIAALAQAGASVFRS